LLKQCPQGEPEPKLDAGTFFGNKHLPEGGAWSIPIEVAMHLKNRK
jgi:hypothetical protein